MILSKKIIKVKQSTSFCEAENNFAASHNFLHCVFRMALQKFVFLQSTQVFDDLGLLPDSNLDNTWIGGSLEFAAHD